MKSKKIFTAMIAAAICAGGVCAVIVALKLTSGRTVTVMPASEFNYYGGFGSTDSMQGVITSDATQDIYLYDTQKVDKVLVTEGQTVNEGDVLMVFDTEQTTRNLEMEKLNRESLQLKLDVAKKNKATLDAMRPTAGESAPFFPADEPEEPEPEPEAPKDVKALDVLDDTSEPWNKDGSSDEDPVGSETNPYRYLCTDGARVRASFIRRLREEAETTGSYFFLLEVRSGNVIEGALLRSWLQDAADLAPVAEDWEGSVDLAGGSPFPGGDPSEQIKNLKTEIDALQKQLADERAAADTEREEAKKKIAELEKEIEELKKKIEELTAAGGTAISLWTDGIPVAELAVVRGDASEGMLTDQMSGLIPGTASYTAEELSEAKRQVEQQLESLSLDLRESELKIRETEKTVGRGEVRAALGGVVKKVGDPERPPTDGSPFLQVTGADGMYVRGGVSEIYLDSISPGNTVIVSSWMSGAVYEATIKEISPYPDTSGMFGWGDTAVSYYPFTALISGSAQDIASGEWVEISLNGGEAVAFDDGRLFLWKGLIRDDSGGKYVYIRDENGLLKKQYVEIGEIQGAGCEIRSGVSGEDWIAFPYGKDVKEGAKTREGSSSDLYEGE